MNPAFGQAQLRELTDVFHDVTLKLCDGWRTKVSGSGTASLDALAWLSRATLDIIGAGGFGYDFDALNERGESIGPSFSRNEAFFASPLSPPFVAAGVMAGGLCAGGEAWLGVEAGGVGVA